MIDNGSVEIDLKEAMRKIAFSLFRNLKAVSLFLLCWALISISILFIQRQKYHLTFSISSDYMSGQKIELIYADLKKLIAQQQYETAARLLNTQTDQVKKIIGITVEVEDPDIAFQGNSNLKPDFYFNETNTTIRLTLTDTLQSDQLVASLNQFLATSSYFNKIKRNEIIATEKINESLEQQKKQLDSLHEINLRKFMTSGGSVVMLNDLSEIKKNIYLIEERLLNNKRGLLRIEEPINLINHPVIKKQTISVQILISLAKGLAITGSAFLLLFCISWFRKRYEEFKTASPR